jgi:small subunit ribosomal protein S5
MLAHKSILGKKKTISCFAVTGNREGIIGYGTGKGPTASGALKLAKAHASQRLLKIDLFENRTLFHDFYEEYYHTKVYAEKKPKGYGLVCHRLIKKICQLLGIKDIYVKVEGSSNGLNITKAFLSGLLNQKKYSDIANAKDLFLVEFKPENNYYPNVLAAPEKFKNNQKNDNVKENEEKYENEYLRDFNLFLFDNRLRAEKKKKLPFYYHDPSYKLYCKLRDKVRIKFYNINFNLFYD